MITAIIIVAYIAIGIYNAIVNEPWWYETLGRPRRQHHPYGYYCEACHAKLNEQNGSTERHEGSGVLAGIGSGVFWPLFPLIKLACERRAAAVKKRNDERKRAAEREKEMKDAEKELGV